MTRSDDSKALSEVTVPDAAAGPDALPDLPEEWVPEGTLIFGVVHRLAGGRWEIMLPFYSIAGEGETFQEAMDETGDLLHDYFRMCALEGLSFDEAERPLPKRMLIPLMAKSMAGSIWSLLRHRPRRDPPESGLEALHLPFKHAY